MPDLTELQELAEDAGDGYMEVKADTAKKLIAVALAAQEAIKGANREKWDAFTTALEELK